MYLFNLLASAPSEEIIEQQTDLVAMLSYIAVGLLVVIGIVFAVFNRNKTYQTKSIAYAAICIALSFALSFLQIKMPYGGSITAVSMLPIILFAYVYGPVRGLLAGIVYGLLQYIQAPYFLSLPQFLFDFILAFSAIALAGVTKPLLKKDNVNIFVGLALVFVGRLAMHFSAGLIFYNLGWVAEIPLVGDGSVSGGILYSLVYNSLYLVPEFLILAAVMVFLVVSKSFSRLTSLLEAGKNR